MAINSVYVNECIESAGCFGIYQLTSVGSCKYKTLIAEVYRNRDKAKYIYPGYKGIIDVEKAISDAKQKIKEIPETPHFKDGILYVPTKNGYIRVTPRDRQDTPGIYIDLISEKISEANEGSTEQDSINLAMVESREGEDYDSDEVVYYTHVWVDGMK